MTAAGCALLTVRRQVAVVRVIGVALVLSGQRDAVAIVGLIVLVGSVILRTLMLCRLTVPVMLAVIGRVALVLVISKAGRRSRGILFAIARRRHIGRRMRLLVLF